MRRSVTEHTEVARCIHQATAEVMHPDTVHDHSRHQRVRTICQPPRECQSPSCCWDVGIIHRQTASRRAVFQNRQLTWRHGLFRLFMITAVEHKGRGRLARNFGQRPQKHFARFGRSQFCRFRGKLFQFVSRLAVVQIKRARGHIDAGVFLEQLLLFGRAFRARCRVGLPSGVVNLFRQFRELLLKRSVNELLLLFRADLVDFLRFRLDLPGLFAVGLSVE